MERRTLFIYSILSLIFTLQFIFVNSLSVVIVPYGFSQLRPAGEAVKFTCSFPGHQPETSLDIIWLNTAGQTILPSDGLTQQNRRIYTREDEENKVTLHIKSLEPEDSGIYTCQVTERGRYYRQSFNLQVFKPIEYKNCPESQTLYRGREGRINCQVEASPSPIVSWTSNGRIIASGQHHEITKKGLVIYDVKDEDSGNYICLTTVSALGSYETRRISVRVIEPPSDETISPLITFINMNTSQSVDDVTLTCVATGKPQPHVTWSRLEETGYQQIQNDENFRVIENDQDGKSVTVVESFKSSPRIVGSFRCTAVNKGGSTEQFFQITKEDLNFAVPEDSFPPKIVWIHTNRSEESFNDMMVTCVTHGSPTPNVRWYRQDKQGNNVTIWSQGRYSITENRGNQKTSVSLIISSAQEQDEGIYFCSASNRLGTEVREFDVTLLEAPPENTIVPEISHLYVNWTGVSEEHLTITCGAQGLPTPQIAFYRQRGSGEAELILGSEGLNVEEYVSANHRTIALTFLNADVSVDGSYQCAASNIAGGVRENFTLNTADWRPSNLLSPHITWIHVNRSGEYGEDIMVTCLAVGNPLPKMEWLRNGARLSQNDRVQIRETDGGVLVLVIQAAVFTDSGNYSCSASNIAGTVQQGFTIESQAKNTFGSHFPNDGDERREERQQFFPDPPSLIRISSDTPTKALVSIRRPSNFQSITSYEVQHTSGQQIKQNIIPFDRDSEFTTIRLDDLLPSTTYNVGVSSVSLEGRSRRTELSYTTPRQWSDSQGFPDSNSQANHEKVPVGVPFNLDLEGDENNQRAVWLSWDWVVYKVPNDYIQGFQILYTSDDSKTFDQWLIVDVTGDSHRTFKITDLHGGSDYSFMIRSRNSYGYGPFSEVYFYRIPLVPDRAPANFVVESVRGNPRSVKFTWSPLTEETSGVPITGYKIYYSSSSGTSPESSMFKTVDNEQVIIDELEYGTTYYFRIQALSVEGGGPISPHLVYRTQQIRAPDPPSYVWVSGGSATDVKLQIHRPESSGGLPITGYIVDYAPVTGSNPQSSGVRKLFKSDDSYSSEVTLHNLTPQTTYKLGVSARSSLGQSEPLEIEFSTPREWRKEELHSQTQADVSKDVNWLKQTTGKQGQAQTLLVPRNLNVEDYSPAKGSLTVRWQRPLLPTLRVKGYDIEWGLNRPDVELQSIIVDGKQTSVQVEGLRTNTAYQFRVRSGDFKGNLSPFSSPVIYTTPALPDPPSDVRINSNEPTEIELRIRRPINLAGHPLIGYRVQYYQIEESIDQETMKISVSPSNDRSGYTSVVIGNLYPSTTYGFQVSSQTDVGYSSPLILDFETLERFQNQGTVGVEQDSLLSQQSQQSEDLDQEWLQKIQQQQKQELVTPEFPVTTERPLQDWPTTDYTVDLTEFKDRLAGLIKYELRYREVDGDQEVPEPLSDFTTVEVDPSQSSYTIRGVKRNHHYQIEIKALMRIAWSRLKVPIKDYVYWVPSENLESPHISHVHQNQTHTDSDDVMITCEATGTPLPQVTWLRQNGEENTLIQTGGRIRVDQREIEGRIYGVLVIQGISDDDYGLYICSATSPAGETLQDYQIQRDLPVTDPVAPHIFRVHVNRTGENGASISAYCRATGIPAPGMRWLRHGDIVFADENGRRRIESQKSEKESLLSLVIDYPVSGDTGEYYCFAENVFGSTRQKFTIHTEYSPENLTPPHIARIHVNRTGVEDKDVFLLCKATGTPAPELRWSRLNDQGNYDIVWPSDKFEISQTQDIDVTVNSLLIRQASEADFGTYRCTASNFADVDNYDVEISSVVQPEDVKSPQLTRLTAHQLMDDDNDITLICSGTGSPPPQMSFLKKTEDGTYGLDFINERITIEEDEYENVSTLSMTFDDPQSSDRGSYICSAANLGGSVQQQFIFNTQGPLINLLLPEIVRITVKPPETKGGSIVLSCVASGKPTPTVRWKAFGKTIVSNERFIINEILGVDETVTSLTILNPDVSDAHSVLCEAENIVGLVDKPYDLSIYDVIREESTSLPHIQHVHLNQTGPQSQGATITCLAVGYPAPSMSLFYQQPDGTWYKFQDGEFLREFNNGEESGIQLVIPNASVENAGLYKCGAENVRGLESHQLQADLPVKIPEYLVQPHISRIHINRTGLNNEDVTVTCVAQGYPAPEMKWLRSDELVLPRGRFHVIEHSKVNNQTIMSLTISQAQTEDEGSYKCSAANLAGSVAKLFDITLQVPVAGDEPYISRIHVNRTGQSGEDVQVTCISSGQPEMSFWKSNGEEYQIVFPEGNIEIMDYKSDDRTVITMVILKPRPDQSGQYQCLARNLAGETSQNFDILTQDTVPSDDSFAPHVARIHVNRTGENDGDVTVTCRVEGYPSPAINWLKRDNSGEFSFIWSTGRYSVYELRDSHATTLRMTITDATPDDDGVYLCSASNIIGDARQLFTLNIFDAPPENTAPPYIKWVHVSREGENDEDVVISCIGTGSPAPEVGLWRRYPDKGQDYLIQVGGRVTANFTKGEKESILNIRLHEALSEDEGSYVCSAANIAGAVKTSFQLQLESSLPEQQVIPHITWVHINHTETGGFMVICIAHGIPLPLMDWLRPNMDNKPKSMEIQSNHVVSEDRTEQKVFFTLVVENPGPEDMGEYYCSARNPAGRIIQKFSLDSQESAQSGQRTPHVVHLHMNTTGENNQDIMITCSTTGYPPPLLSFSRNSGFGDFKSVWPSERIKMQGFDVDKGAVLSMVISKPTPEDEGLYRCSAVNIAGSTSELIKMQLPVAPPEVLEEPFIRHVHINRTSLPNDQLMVTCKATGIPAPEMRWMRKQDGAFKIMGAHAEDVTIELFKGEDNSVLTLVVTDAIPEQWDGHYMCYAVNYAGYMQQDFNLTIQDEAASNRLASVVEHIHINNTKSDREAAMITCLTRGIPSPVVNLFLQDEQGNFNIYWPAEEEDLMYDRGPSTTVISVILRDRTLLSSQWRCKAINVAGTDVQDFKPATKVLDPETTQAPHINRIHIDRVEGRPGDVTMFCRASGKPLPNLNWWKYTDTDFQRIWPEDNVEISANWNDKEGMLNLVIRNATVDDDGEYLCTASNVISTDRQAFDFKLHEYPPSDLEPASISWLHQNRTGPVKQGLMITCVARGRPAPEMRWYKTDISGRNRLVWPSEDVLIEYSELEDQSILTLTIHEPQNQHNVEYFCEAANIGGTVSNSVQVQLKDEPVLGKMAPHVEHIHIDRSGTNGENLVMSCTATGYPAPDIKWKRVVDNDFYYIGFGKRYDVNVTRFVNRTTVTMVIKSVMSEDSGSYVCVANNIAGDVEQEFDITTTEQQFDDGEAPHIEWVHMNRTGLNDVDLSVTCVASGVPPPLINFHKGSTPNLASVIGSSPRVSFYQVQGSSKTTLKMTYHNAQNSDGGPHLCTAANPSGFRRQEFSVITEEPEVLDQQRPYVKNIQLLRTGVERRNILLSCTAEGNPAPELKWWKNEGDTNTPKYSLMWPYTDQIEIAQSKGDNVTVLNLTLVNITSLSDTVTYMCSAENRVGQTRQQFQLKTLPSLSEPEDIPKVNQLVLRRTEERGIKLNCQGNGIPPPELEIFKVDSSGNYQLLQPTDRIRFFETKGVQSSYLGVTINNARSSDEGTYMCSASNSRGVAQNMQDYLLQDAPYQEDETPYVKNIYLNRTGVNNEDIQVTCLVEGSPAPTISWRRDYSRRGAQDYRLLPRVANYLTKSTKHNGYSVGTLVLRRASRREEGWYRCEGQNLVGESKQEFEVVVQDDAATFRPPHIGQIHINKTGDQQQHLLLTCVASGEPAAELRFYKQNEDGNFYLAVPDSEFHISERRGIGQTTLMLTIDNFRLDDFGNYRCAAANLGGRVSRTFNVHIEDTRPEDQETPFVQRIYVSWTGEQDRDVRVTCIATGQPPPEMRWIQRDRSGKEVVWPEERFIISQTKSVGYSAISLIIRGATYGDDGLYVCEAANIADRVQESFSLRVFGPPPQTLSAPALENVAINQTGSDVNIYCIGIGLPAPDIYLSKLDNSGDYVAVQPSSRYEFSQNKESQRTVLHLTIRESTPSDTGSYTCTASSLIGTIHRKFDFSIQDQTAVEAPGRPYVSRITVDQPQGEQDVLTVKCYGQGDPTPDMMLFKRNPSSGLDEQIQAGGRYEVHEEKSEETVLLTVTVENPAPSDSGMFICRAVNSKGTYRTTFNLTVQEYTISRAGQPEFVSPRVERTGVNGVDVKVTCRARGNPPPDLLFLRQSLDGLETRFKAITTDGRYIVEEDKGVIQTKLEVTIRGATSDDAGTYLCSARNNRGSSRQQFKLSIQDTESLPGKPSSLRTRPFETSIMAAWAPPLDRSQQITNYILGYGLGFPDQFTVKLKSNQFTHLIKNLNPGSEYIITVRAENDYGVGERAYVTETTAQRDDSRPFAPLQPVVGLRGQAYSPNIINLRWQDPFVTDQDTNLLYQIKYYQISDGERQVYYLNTTQNGAQIANLLPGQTYEFSVRSLHDGRQSPWSMSTRSVTRNAPVAEVEQVDQGQQTEVPPTVPSSEIEFDEVEVHRTGSSGQDISVVCKASGQPPPNINMFKYDAATNRYTQIQNGERYQLTQEEGDDRTLLTLVISQARSAYDVGAYLCTARNTFYSSRYQFQLNFRDAEESQTSQAAEDISQTSPVFDGVEVERSGELDSDVVVTCRVRGSPAPDINLWREIRYEEGINYQPIQTEGRFTVTVNKEDGLSVLRAVIKDATSEDAGYYICSGRNSFNSIRQQFQLTIEDSSSVEGSPQFDSVDVKRTGSQSQDVVITCKMTGLPPPELILSRAENKEQAIQSGGRYMVTQNKYSEETVLTVIISEATSADAGLYYCSAANPKGSIQQQFTLTIEEVDAGQEQQGQVEEVESGLEQQGQVEERPPGLTESIPKFESVTVDRSGEGEEDVVVRCTVSGLPPPDLRLWREVAFEEGTNYQPVQNGGRYEVGETKYDNFATLLAVIRKATPEDAGIYICSAQNILGRLRQQFQLKIGESQPVQQPDTEQQGQVEETAPVQPEGFPKFEAVNVDRAGQQREDVVVTCKVSGKPSPDLRLWREISYEEGTNYQPVQSGGRIDVIERKYRRFTLLRAVIMDATSADAGKYICAANNSLGSLRQPFKLSISAVEEVDRSKLPQITDINVARSGIANRDFTLTCQATGTPAPTIILQRYINAQQQTQLMESERISIERGESQISVTIREMTASDAGTYQCKASNEFGEVSQQFNLTVEVGTPEESNTLRIGGVSVDSTGENRQDVTITCTGISSPAPNVRLWRYQPENQQRAYTVIRPSNRIEVNQRRGDRETVLQVIIRKSTQKDAGTYICSASSSNDTVRQQFDLTIQDYTVTGENLPKLGEMTVVRTGTNDADALITCTAEGDPPPDVKLYKQNPEEADTEFTLLESGDNLVVNETPGETGTVLTLLVQNVSPADTGVFKCEASNSDGTVSQKFQWQIEAAQSDSPGLPVINSVGSHHIPGSNHVILTCEVASSASVEMKWWRESTSQSAAEYQIIYPTERYVISQREKEDKSILVLTINDPLDGDTGSYLCTAQNEAGSDQKPLDLTLTVKNSDNEKAPSILGGNNISFVNLSSTVKLQCLVSGFPLPEVKWWKHEPLHHNQEFHLILPDINFEISKENGEETVLSTLTVRNVDEDNIGMYLCTAVNKHGSVQHNLTLLLKQPEKVTATTTPVPVSYTTVKDLLSIPHFVEEPKDVLANQNEPVTLICKADGNPSPEITWYKDDLLVVTTGQDPMSRKLQWPDGSLYLPRVTESPEDVGDYYCVASNSQGQVTSRKALVQLTASSGGVSKTPRIILIEELPKTEGEITARCVATGNPPPSLRWWRTEEKDGATKYDLLVNGERAILEEEVNQEETTLTFTLLHPQGPDSGTYLCIASNEFGQIRGVLNITVIEKSSTTTTLPPPSKATTVLSGHTPRTESPEVKELLTAPHFVEEPRDVLANQNEPVTLICKADGNPSPEITWYKDDLLVVTTGQDPMSRKLQWPDGSLYLPRVTESPEDVGDYYCVASNIQGHVTSRKASLNLTESYGEVRNTPQIVILEELPKTEGGITARCVATGNPPPSLKWWRTEGKDGATKYDLLVNGSQIKIERVTGQEETTLTLTIMNSSSYDSGTYLCIASNQFGQIRQAINITSTDSYTTGSPDWTSVSQSVRPVDGQTLENEDGSSPEILRVMRIVSKTHLVHLVCQAVGQPTPQLKWWKYEVSNQEPSYKLFPPSAVEINTPPSQSGAVELTLTLRAPVAEDMGTYQCTAHNYLGTAKRSIDLQTEDSYVFSDGSSVTGRPDTSITITAPTLAPLTSESCQELGRNIKVQPSSDVEARLGDGLVLTCDYTSYSPVYDLQLVWYNPENKAITNNTDRVYSISEGPYRSLLYVAMVNMEDSGDWICTAIVDGQLRCGKVHVHVQYDIDFHRLPGSFNTKEIKDVLLGCQVRGSPLPVVTWSRNGQVIDTSERRFKQSSLGLLIKRVRTSDAGKYLCEATVPTRGRYESREIHLYVDGVLSFGKRKHKLVSNKRKQSDKVPCLSKKRLRVPILSVEPSEGELSAYMGTGVIFTCRILSNHGCDKVTLSWSTPLGQIIQETDTTNRVYVRKSSKRELQLIVRELTDGDSGEWLCSGSTDNTHVSKPVTLSLIKDVEVKGKTTLSIHPGKTAVLECKARGSPLPITSWIRNGKQIQPGERYIPQSYGLMILNVSKEDEGMYTCQAYVPETGRFDSLQIHLHVFAPPSIRIEISNTRVGSFSALICTGNGIPSPSISWYKDGSAITEENQDGHLKLEDLVEGNESSKSLIFIPLQEEDGGNYTCTASNEGGVSEKSFYLQTLSRPGLPGDIEIVEVNSTSVTLAISASEQGNKSPILDYHIAYISLKDYSQSRQTFPVDGGEDSVLTLIELAPQTTYLVRIYARNIVDFGPYKEVYITTAD